MKIIMLNRVAKVHIKILFISLIAFCFLAIPAVMAMSMEEVVALTPYGAIAFFFGIGSAIIRYAQRKFVYLKRSFDIAVASIGVMLTMPLILIFGALIKILSPNGPIFYSQVRVGKGGKIFKIYKLRSMRPDAEVGTGAVWATNDGRDPRVIPFIGHFLRISHIDEVPQFFNVLQGDMSVVGPRPERPEIISDLNSKVTQYDKRLQVKPGITGLAQVHHRADKTLADVKKKVKLDLLYIRKMCFFVELDILLKTAIVVLKGKTI
ncbi:MAG: sugar transferase [PVC group bacterium]|nr:sugar transferase [PVC group bacterium]